MSDKTHKIEWWPTERLVEYDKNAKLHSDEQVQSLAKSIKEHGGIANPLNIEPDGKIITGHGRRLAAISLGMEKVPVIVRNDLTEEQRRALRLADNRTTSVDYDSDLLSAELKELAEIMRGDDDFLDSLGYSEKELDMLTEDLGAINVELPEADFGEQVSQQQNETQTAIDSADMQQVSVSQALGFNSVSTAEAREIKCFIAVIEDDTGLQGREALMQFIKDLNEA